MFSVNYYLNFDGNTEEVFNFYKSVFGGEFSNIQRFGDIPNDENSEWKIAEEDKNKLMHISLPIGKGIELMGSDTINGYKSKLIIGNNIYLSINTDSKDEADNIFNGLSDGGNVEMPLQDTFWGAYYGSFKDKYGILWMINYEYPKA